MKTVTLTEEEFDRISDITARIEMPADNFIPSEPDVFNFIEQHPEKYYKYLLWFSDHRPEAKTEDQKKRMKEIIVITNRTIDIEP